MAYRRAASNEELLLSWGFVEVRYETVCNGTEWKRKWKWEWKWEWEWVMEMEMGMEMGLEMGMEMEMEMGMEWNGSCCSLGRRRSVLSCLANRR